ncbi:translocation/assembly module TamB domain-containing protein [Marinobacter halotolerans]|uniref:translocation/assembly module TamB domain-containing protein n=1 Tax=Marinobacter halotolerans TaxID=1569211 RepID=UPI001CD9ADA8|nr:translocation/assembly module TamB domain-containing protein [Marinobacter halotolerans]
MTETQNAQTPQTPPPERHRLRFWLLTLLAVLVLLPVILIGALFLVLRSDTGTAWVIDQVPGLQVTNGQGSLLGRWQAEQLVWQGFGTGVEVSEPLIDWSPTCLFQKAFCLEQLTAESVSVTLMSPQTDQSKPSPIELPTLDLPLSMRIGSVDIGPLTVNEQTAWDRLQLSATGSGSDWNLSQLSLVRGAIELDLSGNLEMRGDWPLGMTANVQLPPVQDEAWSLDLNLSGSVAELLVSGNSKGYLQASLSGSVQPLKPELPASLQVKTDSFRAADTLPETLTLLNTDIALQGSLENGFRAKGKGQLPGADGKIGLALSGLVTTTGIQNLDLSLTGKGTGDAEKGTASVEGSLSWAEALALDAQVLLDAFPWYNLVPGVAPPPVVLNRLSGDLAYSDGSYNATLEAVVDSPQGRANLESKIDGDLESLTLSELKVNSGAGFLSGRANLGFAGPLSWDANLQLSEFNPGYWVPAATASLSGEVTTEGKLASQGPPSISATWDLQGTWRASDAEIRGKLRQSGDALALSEFELQVADNRIAGQGQWGQKLSGDFQLNMSEPELLLPQLEGGFNGNLSVSGTPEAPLGNLTVSGKNVGWDDLVEVDGLELTASLSEGQTVSGGLTATGVSGAGQKLKSLSLELSGTRQDHQLTVSAIQEQAEVLFRFAGGAGADWASWKGQLETGEIDIPGQDQYWRLNQPADLAYDQSGQLTFGRHCWSWQQASVCAGRQILLPQLALDYTIRNFPTTALAPLVPETLKWDTLLDAELTFNTKGSGPEGSLKVNAGSGEFSVLNAGEWESFNYNTLTSDVKLLPEQANLSFELEGPRLGNLSANVSVDPMSEERTLDGQFRISNLDIAMAAVFADLEEVKGQINGQGQISGPLMKPAIDGELVLSGGEISDPSLPMSFEKLVASVTFNGYQADLSGRWQSNARSSGTLEGTASWKDQPTLTLSLAGDRLPFYYEPYADLELNPDLEITYRTGELSISGRLAVPRGKIEITELPEQAVSVSEDEVIVGREARDSGGPAVNLDITVVVGEDEVSFNGFEVTGDLKGTLRIGNDLNTRGSLRLINGRYEAYGQELELRRARLIFTGPLTEPYVDIEAIRRVDTVIAGIRLSGPVTKPQTEVFSEPDMPQTDALSYLILGKPPGAPSQGGDAQMRSAAIALGLNQTAGVTRGIGEELGIEQLTLETQGSGTDSAVVASGYLSEDLSVRYGVGIFEPFTTVALRYDLGRYFYLEAASGLASSLDIFYTRDF